MKVMFFSGHALADSCSGAAKCVQTLLEELTRLGHGCLAVTGPVVDGDGHLSRRVMASKPQGELKTANGQITFPLRRVKIAGVPHFILGDKAKPMTDLTAVEDIVLKELFLKHFDEFAPDVLLTYGGFSSAFVAGQHALAHGRMSVLFAATDSNRAPGHFIHVNRVVTVSRALEAQLRQAASLPITRLSAMVNKGDVTARERKPEYIVFVNPALSKGLKLAVAVAKASQERGKAHRFLFVEARGTRASARADCPEIAQSTNIDFAENVSDMRAVYGRARVVLYPSLRFEGAGRVAIEANANGIPVIAHNIGGVAEMLDGAGFLFDPPAEMRKDWRAEPLPEVVDKWLEVIDRLTDDAAALADAEARARAADARYSLTGLAERFTAALG